MAPYGICAVAMPAKPHEILEELIADQSRFAI
jgi:hypothetical protein